MQRFKKFLFLATSLFSLSSLFALNINEIFFVKLSELRPTQVRYSSANVKDKINKAIKQGDTDKCFSFFKYDNGKSIYSNKDAIPVVATDSQFPLYYLVDGHHSVLASLQVKAQTIPIKIVAIYYPKPDTDFFWEWMQKKHFSFLKDIDGSLRIPKNFNSLTDDPLRYFAAISARKFEKDTTYENSTGHEYPLWVKIGKDIPFIEFFIADALKDSVTYSYEEHFEDNKNKLQFQNKIELARNILLKKIQEAAPSSPLKLLKLLPNKEFYLKSTLIQNWLKQNTITQGC